MKNSTHCAAFRSREKIAPSRTGTKHLVEPPAALADLTEQLPPLYDVLKAVFPPGALTGAPKFRVVEFIDELEPAILGTFGHLSFGGDMGVATRMRTGIVKDHTL